MYLHWSQCALRPYEMQARPRLLGRHRGETETERLCYELLNVSFLASADIVGFHVRGLNGQTIRGLRCSVD